MKKAILFLLTVLTMIACQNQPNPIQILNTKYGLNLQKGDCIYLYKEPGCSSCNKAFYKYFQNKHLPDKAYLIYNCAYPDTSKLNFFRQKFKSKCFLERTDTLYNIFSNRLGTGKIKVTDQLQFNFKVFDPQKETMKEFVKN